MNRKETVLVLGTLQAAYPSFYRGQTREQIEAVINLWESQFAEADYKMVSAAVKGIIATRTESFPPTIGLVNEMIRKLSEPWLTPMEAWGIVRKALRNGIYGAEEEWAKFPEEVKAAITPEQIRSWAADDNFNEGVVSSNFMRSFTIRQKNNQDMKVIEERLKIMPLSFSEKLGIAEGGANQYGLVEF